MMEWIGLAALGAFGAAVYRGYNWAVEWLRRTLTVEIEIKERGAFNWVAEWLAIEGEKTHCRKLTAQEHDVAKPGEIYSPLRSRVLFIPGIGAHVFTHNGRRVFAERTEESGSKVGEVITDFNPEKITLRIWGRDVWRLKKLVTDAEYVYRVRRNHSLSMWVGTTWGDWNESALSCGRAASTVMLPKGSMETLLVDVRKFLGMRDRYDAIGVPYRRGYIFHGIPGCGKSSLAKAIATECGLNLYVLALSSGINDAQLQRCLDQVRPHSVVLLEDVDAAYSNDTIAKGEDGLSRSGFLNALDGVSAAEGRVLIMTTNHFTALDDALIRPGRVDVTLELKEADKHQAYQFFTRFFPGANGEAEEFAQLAAGTTPAYIQGHLLANWDNPQTALQGWST